MKSVLELAYSGPESSIDSSNDPVKNDIWVRAVRMMITPTPTKTDWSDRFNWLADHCCL